MSLNAAFWSCSQQSCWLLLNQFCNGKIPPFFRTTWKCCNTWRNMTWKNNSFKYQLLSGISLYSVTRGRRLIGISGSLIWSKTLMELIFNPYGEFWWSPECPVSQIHSLYLHVGALGSFRCVQMLNREWGAESNGKLPHQFIPSKISWHLSYGKGNTSEETSTKKLTRPEIEHGPATWGVMMLPLAQRWSRPKKTNNQSNQNFSNLKYIKRMKK